MIPLHKAHEALELCRADPKLPQLGEAAAAANSEPSPSPAPVPPISVTTQAAPTAA